MEQIGTLGEKKCLLAYYHPSRVDQSSTGEFTVLPLASNLNTSDHKHHSLDLKLGKD